MTYLSDKRTQRNRFTYKLICFLVLVAVIVFWVQIRIFTLPAVFFVTEGLFRIKISTVETLTSINSFFSSKSTLEDTISILEKENSQLANEIAEKDFLIASYDEAFITDTRSSLNTVQVFPMFRSLELIYDTFVISKGFKDGMQEGMVVYGSGYIPYGKIINVGPQSSVVQLISADGVESDGVTSGSSSEKVSFRLVGIGGGDFISSLPKDVQVKVGADIMWNDNPKMKLGTVVSVENEPQAIFQKIIIKGLFSPTNTTLLYVDIQ